jgi:Tfp pilus assembly protein PilO
MAAETSTTEGSPASWEKQLQRETECLRQAAAAYQRTVVALRVLEAQLERFDERLDALVRTLRLAVDVLAHGAIVERIARGRPTGSS